METNREDASPVPGLNLIFEDGGEPILGTVALDEILEQLKDPEYSSSRITQAAVSDYARHIGKLAERLPAIRVLLNAITPLFPSMIEAFALGYLYRELLTQVKHEVINDINSPSNIEPSKEPCCKENSDSLTPDSCGDGCNHS